VRKHKLLVLIATLVVLVGTEHSDGAEYRKDTRASFVQVDRSTVHRAANLLDHHSDGFKKCNGFKQQINAAAVRGAPIRNRNLYPLYTAPSIWGLAHGFRRVQVLTHKQLRCEREERQRARRQAELTKCARQVSETYGVNRPKAAPWRVKTVLCAASSIDGTPYIWGGGHNSFESSGYDCSGAVSFALHGGGFLSSPLDSTGLETWGMPGPGNWITVYANSGHAWMVIAGLAFDTVGGPGPRWHPSPVDSTAGFVARHPAGY
jgi:hypothetical protein